MNSKLNILYYLLSSTDKELNTIEEYKNFKRELRVGRNTLKLEIGEKDADKEYYKELYNYTRKFGEGNKQKVKDNLKMIRRITLEIEKEL